MKSKLEMVRVVLLGLVLITALALAWLDAVAYAKAQLERRECEKTEYSECYVVRDGWHKYKLLRKEKE